MKSLIGRPDLGEGASLPSFEKSGRYVRWLEPAGTNPGPTDALQHYCQACTALKGVITRIRWPARGLRPPRSLVRFPRAFREQKGARGSQSRSYIDSASKPAAIIPSAAPIVNREIARINACPTTNDL